MSLLQINLSPEKRLGESVQRKRSVTDSTGINGTTVNFKKQSVIEYVARSIPDRLVFNHKAQLLATSSLDSPIIDQILNVPLRENVNKIIHLHRHSSLHPNITDVEFLDDVGCSAAIERAHSRDLAMFFNNESTGMYKSDICRLAQLALKGGYYADNDLDVLADFRTVIPPEASFASVIALPWKGPRNPNQIFQAFLAAAPHHPVILSSLDKGLEFYKGGNKTLRKLLGNNVQGSALVRVAYEEWLGNEMEPGLQEKLGENKFKYSYLLEEARLKASDPKIQPQIGEGWNCNIAVLDRSQHKVLAWSHIVGSHSCLPK